MKKSKLKIQTAKIKEKENRDLIKYDFYLLLLNFNFLFGGD